MHSRLEQRCKKTTAGQRRVEEDKRTVEHHRMIQLPQVWGTGGRVKVGVTDGEAPWKQSHQKYSTP